MRYLQYISILMIVLVVMACNRGPKVIESEPSANAQNTNHEEHSHDNDLAQPAALSEAHQVTVDEVLNTDKYTYLHVSEEGEKFWIAVSKRDAQVGDTYYYKGGLLKKNFYSREYDRVFETLYLVSDIRKQPVATGDGSAMDEALQNIQAGNAIPQDAPIDVQQAEGSVKLSELFANKEKYEGKTIQVTGKVVKINPNIMNRNWVHLRDGTGDDLDLTVTTSATVPLGHTVTMEGVISLNKDFGAGYRYDIILEQAVLK